MITTERVHSPTPEELMAFLDGETPAEARAAVETHIATCAGCRKTIAHLRGVSHAMSAWETEAAPVTLRPPRVTHAKGWSLPALSWRPSYFAISLGTAAVIVLLVVTLLPFARRTPSVLAATAADQTSVLNGAIDGRLERSAGAPRDAFRVSRAQPGGSGGGRPTLDESYAAKATPPPPQMLAAQAGLSVSDAAAAPRQPSVIRTATLQIVATDFDAARARVEGIVAQSGGFLDQITVNGGPGSARTLSGTLRVPAVQLAEALAKLRQLGQVTADTQGSEDVTDQLIDLDARLTNAREAEQRLNDLLKNRTGKLSDVIELEREISRVRLQIEQMDAQRLNTSRRVSYATITLEIDEVRKAGLESGPLSLTTRLRVAAADGLEAALENMVGAVLFILRAGPALMLWIGAGLLVWMLVRRRLFRLAATNSSTPRASE
jgi:hypothetical protein